MLARCTVIQRRAYRESTSCKCHQALPPLIGLAIRLACQPLQGNATHTKVLDCPHSVLVKSTNNLEVHTRTPRDKTSPR